MSSKIGTKDNKHSILSVLSGTLVSVATTLILILLFAVVIRFFNIGDSWIFPVNQVIKIISLFIGIVVTVKKTRSKGFFSGILLALIYYILSFVVFGILQGGFSVSLNNLFDLLLTMLMGGIIGIIVVNVGKK